MIAAHELKAQDRTLDWQEEQSIGDIGDLLLAYLRNCEDMVELKLIQDVGPILPSNIAISSLTPEGFHATRLYSEHYLGCFQESYVNSD